VIEIVAEIGVNHQGSVGHALNLVDAAIACGVDAVKFQAWRTERVYSGEEATRMAKLELSRESLAYIKNYCDQKRIEFICTPDEYDDAVFLKALGVRRIKTSSQDITNLPFLRQVSMLGLPMIVSTGASTEDEVRSAMKVLFNIPSNYPKPTLLHCVSAYPAPLDQMNLRAINFLRGFYCKVGLSDHTERAIAAVMAVALGATVFEKHITMDRRQSGPDHAASLTPAQMSVYVQMVRSAEKALGDGIKGIMPCEQENRARFENFIRPRKEA